MANKLDDDDSVQPRALPSQPPGPLAVFIHWQRAELNAASNETDTPDTDFPGRGYALVWNAWIQQVQGNASHAPRPGARGGKAVSAALAQPPRSWHEATAEDVAHFLQIRPGQRAHHQPQRQISEVTRRRYWRLLDRVYAHALLHGWVASNPVQAVHPYERPAPEQPTGHVLPPALWAALPRYFPGSDDLQGARDLAVLRLLYDLALAPEEIRLLTIGALRNAGQASLGEGEKPCFVQIEGQRAAQRRCLPLPAPTAAVLSAWMSFRRRSGTPATVQAPLFESRKGGPLTIRALFHIASKTIERAQQAGTDQAVPLARMGPQVLRNTAIVQWLHQGLAPTEVVQRIGVDHPRALAHLQHCVDALKSVRFT